MAPRFVNPHSLADNSVLVSRAEILGDYKNETEDSDNEPEPSKASLIRKLDDYLHAQLQYPEPADSSESATSEKRKKKRQNVEPTTEETVESSELIPFRLLSGSGQVNMISLLPEPLPEINIRVREPASEDDPAEADERAKRAKAVAVDASHILNMALTSDSILNFGKLLSVTSTSFPMPTPRIMFIDLPQPFRATRPPVPWAELVRWPYKQGQSAPSSHSDRSIRTFEASPSKSDVASSKRNRRRRQARRQKQHPQPTFWRPDSSWRGKCMGYAMGY